MSLKTDSPYAPSPRVLADRIKAERERLGITQEEAARRLKIGRNAYKQLESVANPMTSRLIDLVRTVGMDARALVPELLDDTPAKPKPPKPKRVRAKNTE